MDSASGLDCDQIRVAAFQTQRGTDSCDHSLGGQGSVQQQHPDRRCFAADGGIRGLLDEIGY
jgi:hypothetical protein